MTERTENACETDQRGVDVRSPAPGDLYQGLNKEDHEKEAGTDQEPASLLKVLTPEVAQRLYEKIDRSQPEGCHPWTAATSSSGYGRFWMPILKKTVPAHRAVMVLHLGRDLDPDEEVHHVCKNRLCCNPDHLQVVDHAENMALVETCDHSQSSFERDSRGRPFCPECFVDRAWAHNRREPIDDLPADLAPVFLEFFWVSFHRDRLGLVPPPITSKDQTALGHFVRSLGEHRAFMALRQALRDWARFTAYAECEYGASWGRSYLPPRRPVLQIVTKNSGAAVNFWREHDPAERELRRFEAKERCRREIEEEDRCWREQEELEREEYACRVGVDADD